MAFEPPQAPPTAEVYGALQERVSALAVGLDEERLQRSVGACPEWTVTDLLAHLTGLAVDVASGNADPSGGDAWTAAQVEPRRGRPVPELMAEWAEATARLGPALSSPGGSQIVMDAATHEQDLRAAVDEPLRPPDGDLLLALRFTTTWSGYKLERVLGLPTIETRTPLGVWRMGRGEPAVSVTAGPLDLLRSMTGRRTWDQVTALDWSADPGPWREAFTWGPFSPPSTPSEDLTGQ